jgi:hypothetical protein
VVRRLESVRVVVVVSCEERVAIPDPSDGARRTELSWLLPPLLPPETMSGIGSGGSVRESGSAIQFAVGVVQLKKDQLLHLDTCAQEKLEKRQKSSEEETFTNAMRALKGSKRLRGTSEVGTDTARELL